MSCPECGTNQVAELRAHVQVLRLAFLEIRKTCCDPVRPTYLLGEVDAALATTSAQSLLEHDENVRKEEREACAQLVEDWKLVSGKVIPNAIRARGAKP